MYFLLWYDHLPPLSHHSNRVLHTTFTYTDILLDTHSRIPATDHSLSELWKTIAPYYRYYTISKYWL